MRGSGVSLLPGFVRLWAALTIFWLAAAHFVLWDDFGYSNFYAPVIFNGDEYNIAAFLDAADNAEAAGDIEGATVLGQAITKLRAAQDADRAQKQSHLRFELISTLSFPIVSLAFILVARWIGLGFRHK